MTILRTDVLERLSRIVRQERGALVAVARSEGLDAEEAVECVQDALATFLSREETVQLDPQHEIASLKTIVRNAARNFRRAHRRRMPHAPIEDGVLPAIDPNAEALLAHAEDVVRLRACVAELCSIQRAVITLRLLEERSGEDVAVQLGITRKHVDVLVHRAKASLRVCMRHSTRQPNGRTTEH
jgi:RNA polymerase sigma-70 factor, ECF subfamily